MYYLKIIEEEKNIFTSKKIKLSIFFRIIDFFIPIANPSFEYKIKNMKYWLLEFNDEKILTREIGLNKNNEVKMIMPYKRNYGY